MLSFVGRRLIIMFITLYVIISATWVMSKALPGTPFADEKLTPSSREVLFEKYGLDDPLPVQYVRYMLNVAQGDLGNSFYFESRPVTQIILKQAPISAFIGVQAIIFGLIPGLVLGVLAALRHNGILDYLGTAVAVAGIAVPSFVLGPIMQYWLGYQWELLPIASGPLRSGMDHVDHALDLARGVRDGDSGPLRAGRRCSRSWDRTTSRSPNPRASRGWPWSGGTCCVTRSYRSSRCCSRSWWG